MAIAACCWSVLLCFWWFLAVGWLSFYLIRDCLVSVWPSFVLMLSLFYKQKPLLELEAPACIIEFFRSATRPFILTWITKLELPTSAIHPCTLDIKTILCHWDMRKRSLLVLWLKNEKYVDLRTSKQKSREH